MRLESFDEIVEREDYIWLATAAVAVPLLINLVHPSPDWKQWLGFCQNRTEVRAIFQKYKGLFEIGQEGAVGLVCNLINAGVLMRIKPQEAEMIIRQTMESGVCIDELAAAVMLTTIYGFSGEDQYKREVRKLSKVDEEQWWTWLKSSGIKPDYATVDRLGGLFAGLVNYI